MLQRDGFACVYCGAAPPDCQLQVDHVRPVATGGTNDPDNLVAACGDCNLGKASRLLLRPVDQQFARALATQLIEFCERKFGHDFTSDRSGAISLVEPCLSDEHPAEIWPHLEAAHCWVNANYRIYKALGWPRDMWGDWE